MTKNYFRLFVWSLLAMLGVTQSAFAEVVTAQWDWQTTCLLASGSSPLSMLTTVLARWLPT